MKLIIECLLNLLFSQSPHSAACAAHRCSHKSSTASSQARILAAANETVLSFATVHSGSLLIFSLTNYTVSAVASLTLKFINRWRYSPGFDVLRLNSYQSSSFLLLLINISAAQRTFSILGGGLKRAIHSHMSCLLILCSYYCALSRLDCSTIKF